MPNWAAAATGFSYPGGGPAGNPTAIDPGNVNNFGQYAFPGNGPLDQMVTRVRGTGAPADVAIAILDTWPGQAARTAFGALNTVTQDQKSITQVVVDETVLREQSRFSGTIAQPCTPGARVNIADHGFFAAGIIRDMAPRVPLYPIRILDEYGVGSLSTIAYGLVRLATDAAFNDRLLVVNLSLEILPSEELFAEQIFRGFADPDGDERRKLLRSLNLPALDVREDYHFLSWLLWLIFHLTGDALRANCRDVLFVAAAGNEGYFWRDMPVHPEPSTPAWYDGEGVISVAAVNDGANPSHFSNRADFSGTSPNGVAVLGGEVDPNTCQAVPGHGVVGLSTASQYGWYEWAGTSFSAAIIGGIAAGVWSDDVVQKNVRPAGKVADETTISFSEPDRLVGLGCRPIVATQKRT